LELSLFFSPRLFRFLMIDALQKVQEGLPNNIRKLLEDVAASESSIDLDLRGQTSFCNSSRSKDIQI